MKLTLKQGLELRRLALRAAEASHDDNVPFEELVEFVEGLTPGTEWGVLADPKVGVHTFALEATARATVDVTPEGQKPKLVSRAVGPWKVVE